MTLNAAFSARRGEFTLEVDLAVEAGQVVAVLGPNGAGKTTLLRVLAGLQRVESGTIALDGRELARAGSVEMAPEARGAGVVFQEGHLFPHLSVRGNVEFGLRARGREGARELAGAWLARLGLAGLEDAKPHELSGGQAQRVALARALAPAPSLLLLDEPLAALDASTRQAVRAELRRHLAGFDGVALLVTHDPVDAALADRVLVLEEGRITHRGTLRELALRPRSRYLADLFGLNLWHGTSDGQSVAVAGGRLDAVGIAGEVFAALSPGAVLVSVTDPGTGLPNRRRGRVLSVEQRAGAVLVKLDAGFEVVGEAGPAGLELAGGDEAWVTFEGSAVAVYPA